MVTEILPELESTSKNLIKGLSAFSQDKLNIVPFEGSWTAGQVGDHLLKSYGLVEVLHGEIKTTERSYNEKVPEIRSALLNFDLKMQSPEFIIPSDTTINKEALLSSIEHRISQLYKIIQNEDLTVTCLSFVIPQLGEMTRYEWIYFIIYHTQRHINQLNNIAEKLNIHLAGQYR